jgi:glycerol-3-phosphate acyltransferase PlsY
VTFAVAEMTLLWPDAFSSVNWSRGAFALAVPALIIFRHRSNIVRLLKGEEHRFTRKAREPQS